MPTSVQVGVRRWTRRWVCDHPGCPSGYVSEAAARAHEALPHEQCTCGRWFEQRRGLPAHVAQVRRRRLPHPARVDERYCRGGVGVPLRSRLSY